MEWKKFRKKPIVVEARQMEIVQEIITLEGILQGEPGDWLVRGIRGEEYPVRNDIFRDLYDEVVDE